LSTDGQAGTVDQLKSLYREAVTRHSAHPTGFRQAIAATHRHELYNAQCGDRVEIALEVNDGVIRAAAFDGEACAICRASASMLCEVAPGRNVDSLIELHRKLQEALGQPVGALNKPVGAASAANRGDRSEVVQEQEAQSRLKPLLPMKLHPLLGVRPYPSRVQCATLPWRAAELALSG